MRKIPVGIVGISGYTGLELFKLLFNHPHFEITYLANSSGESSLGQIHPSLSHLKQFQIQKAHPDTAAKSCELVFLALPHQESMTFCQKLLKHPHIRAIDLSADYRLSLEHYEAHYCPHTDATNLEHAIYGLVEYQRERIANARLVANPGCYPTASLLALLPFLPYIDSSVFIDAKSGVSGAGKKLSPNTHYPFINENIFAYNPLKHRHQIEISEKCLTLGGTQAKINFIPHLTPLTQGMLVSVFATLKAPLDPLEILTHRYENEPFIRVRNTPVDVLNTKGTNFCDLYAQCSGKDLFINASIDNLMRGASSQALVNANIMCGFDEDLGVPKMG